MNSINKIWLWIKNFLFTSEEKVIVDPAPIQEPVKVQPVLTPKVEQTKPTTKSVYTPPYIAPTTNLWSDDSYATRKRREAEEEEVRRRRYDNDSSSDMMTAALLASMLSSNNTSYENKSTPEPKFESGKGGDYSGAGASGSWENTPEPVRHSPYSVLSESVSTYESKSETSCRADSYESPSSTESTSNNDSYSDSSTSSSTDSYSSSD